MRHPLGRLVLTALLVLLGLTVAAPAHAVSSPADYEAQLVREVNRARVEHGLPPVVVSTGIATVARGWSQEMARSGTFAHSSTYAQRYPSGWLSASENIAWGATSSGQYAASAIHDGFMGSAGHRANILRADTTHIGIGVAFVTRNGKNYVYVTQNFARYPTLQDAAALVSAIRPFDQIVASADVAGDMVGDVFAVDGSGRLYLFSGSGTGALAGARSFGTGWGSLRLFAPGDWDGDRRADLVVADGAGRLYLYRGDGAGGVGDRVQIGRGWSAMRVVPAGDVSGDRRADLLAVDTAGRLWVYPGNGSGGFGTPQQVGRGWGGVALHAAGDMNADGRADVLGIDSAGKLRFYAGRGGGALAAPVQVGRGWSGLAFASGADLDLDGLNDLVGRDSSGRLWFYAGRHGGSFASAVQVAQGW